MSQGHNELMQIFTWEIWATSLISFDFSHLISLNLQHYSGSLFTKKTASYHIGIPIVNLRRSSDRLRFIIGIPILYPLDGVFLVNRGPGVPNSQMRLTIYAVRKKSRFSFICCNKTGVLLSVFLQIVKCSFILICITIHHTRVVKC